MRTRGLFFAAIAVCRGYDNQDETGLSEETLAWNRFTLRIKASVTDNDLTKNFVKDLTEEEYNVHIKHETTGESLLHPATKFKALTIMEDLLENGADVNAQNTFGGGTPLHIAAYRGIPEAVDLLLKAGADYGIPAKDGKRPWDLAAKYEREEVLALLRDNGDDGEAPTEVVKERGAKPVPVKKAAAAAAVDAVAEKGAPEKIERLEQQVMKAVAARDFHEAARVQEKLDKVQADLESKTPRASGGEKASTSKAEL